jgi:hypothetical protein
MKEPPQMRYCPGPVLLTAELKGEPRVDLDLLSRTACWLDAGGLRCACWRSGRTPHIRLVCDSSASLFVV